jgi:hypothetical protein
MNTLFASSSTAGTGAIATGAVCCAINETVKDNETSPRQAINPNRTTPMSAPIAKHATALAPCINADVERVKFVALSASDRAA